MTTCTDDTPRPVEPLVMRVLDLFSGIGGFSLGLERAGMKTVAFCEIDPFCRAVLRKHWPNVQIFEDVRTLTHEQVGAVDVICGGFPCQDISEANSGARGLRGTRSGLWFEFFRLVREIRPKFVIVENVAALLGRGLGTVLGNLAEIGYDAEWHCIPAHFVNAPHRRDRVFVVAHSNGERPQAELSVRLEENEKQAEVHAPRGSDDVPNRPGWCLKLETSVIRAWEPEPAVGRVADGVPRRMDRLKALGNAVVPQIPELLGRAILNAHNKG